MNTEAWLWENRCTKGNGCNVVYSLGTTPLLYYLSPPVTYYGADLGIVFDPRGT
jgi:hypothetical protein